MRYRYVIFIVTVTTILFLALTIYCMSLAHFVTGLLTALPAAALSAGSITYENSAISKPATNDIN